MNEKTMSVALNAEVLKLEKKIIMSVPCQNSFITVTVSWFLFQDRKWLKTDAIVKYRWAWDGVEEAVIRVESED